jgi:ribosome-associated protein
MEKETFELRPTEEFIELVKLLKVMQISQTGGHGKLIIEEGAVQVNGEQEFRKRKKLRKGDLIQVDSLQIQIV